LCHVGRGSKADPDLDLQVRISDKALAGLEKILAYSWAQHRETTESFVRAIFDHIEMLRRFPYAGSPLRGRRGERCLVHTPLLIYYRVKESASAIEILRIRHAARR